MIGVWAIVNIAKVRQLEVFRDAIGEGLAAHFHDNPLIQTNFEWENQSKQGGKTKDFSKGRKNLRSTKISERIQY